MRLAVAVTAGLSLLCAAAPASAAKPPPWKVVKQTNLRGNENLSSIAAGSRTSAWAFGSRTGERAQELLAYRWNGRTWSRSTLPKGLNDFNPYAEVQVMVSASSSRNAWAVAVGDYRFEEMPTGPLACPERTARRAGGVEIFQPSRILRWAGGKWVVDTFAKKAVVTSIVAHGAGQAWAFGIDAKGGDVAWRFNGKRWRAVKVPFSLTEAKASGRYLWAYGVGRDLEPTVQRFDGRTWKKVGLTGLLPKPVTPTQDHAGVRSLISGISPTSGGQVTVFGSFEKVPRCGYDQPDGSESVVGHWNGHGWKRDTAKVLKSWNLLSLVPDGRGGDYALGFRYPTFVRGVFHRSAEGRWTGEAMDRRPWMLQALAAVPGTGRLWGVGGGQPKWDNDGVILLR
jgi:hypothetical protein